MSMFYGMASCSVTIKIQITSITYLNAFFV